MKKSILFTIMISLFIIMGNKSTGAVSGDDNKWILKKSSGNVDLYYKIGECEGSKVIFLKFENKNKYDVQVSWKEAITDKTYGNAIDSYSGQKQLILSPGITQQDDCSNVTCKECLIKMTEVSPVLVVDPVEIEFKDISVTQVSK
jgi:hypothetical protein